MLDTFVCFWAHRRYWSRLTLGSGKDAGMICYKCRREWPAHTTQPGHFWFDDNIGRLIPKKVENYDWVG